MVQDSAEGNAALTVLRFDPLTIRTVALLPKLTREDLQQKQTATLVHRFLAFSGGIPTHFFPASLHD